jgi:hypothetical protein
LFTYLVSLVVVRCVKEDILLARNAQNTSKVTNKVIAAIIRSIWYQVTKEPFCVDMNYLSRVCDKLCPSMDKIKSDLGITLSIQIATIDTDSNAGSIIVRVLTSASNTLCADMLRNVLAVIGLLGTTYSFMIPSMLSKILNRVDLFDGGAAILRKECKIKDMVNVNGGYNIYPTKFDKPYVILALDKTIRLGHNRTNAVRLCNAIKQSLISNDGGFIAAPSRAKPSQFSACIFAKRAEQDLNIQQTQEHNEEPKLDLDELLTPCKGAHK